MNVILTALITVGATVLVIFAMIGILYSVRGTPVSRVRAHGGAEDAPPVSDALFLDSIQLFTGTPLMPGNRIEVARNGDETYPRLWEDLRSARKSITMQMYYCKLGRMADTLEQILTERARAGVQVLFLADAFGAQSLTGEYLDRLRSAGVRVTVFRPVKWYQLHQMQHRSHIRVVVVDGEVGWTGGFGIDDKWFGDGRTPGQWRETNARFTGPAVSQLQAIFATGWAEATGHLLLGPPLFAPRSAPEDGALAGVMHAAPTVGTTSAERLLAMSIAGARKTLYIANSYFVPDEDFRGLLKRAAGRGVDVRILTPDENSDVKTTWFAGRYYHEELLEAGVRFFEYKASMMHAKTLVVDGIFSSVGTLNFDNRSMAFNDESNINVYDEDFGRCMVEIFLEDLEFAEEETLETFRRRPRMQRLMEWKAARLQRIL